MKSVPVVLFIAIVAASAYVSTVRCEEVDDKIKKALSRKISFEFVDLPLFEAFDFIRKLSNVTIVVDPKVVEAKDKLPITLHIADMEMEKALQWVLKLAELEYKIQDDVVYIYAPEQKKPAEKAGKKDRENNPDTGILRLKFASGDTVEADAVMLQRFPILGPMMLSMAVDPGKDAILVLAPGRDIPPIVDIADFIKSAQTLAPGAEITFDDKLKLLYVRSKDDADLRRINAVARALRPGLQMGMPNGRQDRPDMSRRISLKVQDQPLKQVLEQIGRIVGMNFMAGDKNAGRMFAQPVTVQFEDSNLKECLNFLSTQAKLRFDARGDTIVFSTPDPENPKLAVKPPRPPDDPDMKGNKKQKNGEDLQF